MIIKPLCCHSYVANTHTALYKLGNDLFLFKSINVYFQEWTTVHLSLLFQLIHNKTIHIRLFSKFYVLNCCTYSMILFFSISPFSFISKKKCVVYPKYSFALRIQKTVSSYKRKQSLLKKNLVANKCHVIFAGIWIYIVVA